MSRGCSLMDIWMKRCLWYNPKASLIQFTHNMCTSCIKLYVGSSKPLEHGTIGWLFFSLNKAIHVEVQITRFLSRNLVWISWLLKSSGWHRFLWFTSVLSQWFRSTDSVRVWNEYSCRIGLLSGSRSSSVAMASFCYRSNMLGIWSKNLVWRNINLSVLPAATYINLKRFIRC